MPTKLSYEFKLKVEVARHHHLEVMGEISKVAAPKWYKKSYLRAAIRHKRAFVALVGRIPGAFLVWNRDFYGYYFIDLLVVHPELRRKGLGRLLIKAMEKRCVGQRLYTSTNRSNTVMQQVLKRMGYKRVGYISNVDRGDPEWIYYKRL
jgi:GNAT superfamily N-acetyltransferase